MDGGVSYRWSPKYAPGDEGIGIGWYSFRGHRSLGICYCCAFPVEPQALKLANRLDGLWEPLWNAWLFPIKSQTVLAALGEIISFLDVAFFEIDWLAQKIPVFFSGIDLAEQEQKALEGCIQNLNNYLDLEGTFPRKTWVVPGLSISEIDAKAEALFAAKKIKRREITPSFRLAVLRHQYTAYDALAAANPRSYESNTRKIMAEISRLYPWSAEAAEQFCINRFGEGKP